MLDAASFFASVVPEPTGPPITTGPPGEDPGGELLRQLGENVPDVPDARQFLEQSTHVGEDWGDSSRPHDVIASYASFHRFGPARWGITFRTEPFVGLLGAAVESLEGQGLTIPQPLVASWLRKVVFAHELFHFQVEWAATVHEGFLGHPAVYDRFLDLRRSAHGLTDVGELDEALATATEVDAAKGLEPALGRFYSDRKKGGAPGYRNFEEVLTPDDRQKGWKRLLTMAFGQSLSTELLRPEFGLLYADSVPCYRKDLTEVGKAVPDWVLPRSQP